MFYADRSWSLILLLPHRHRPVLEKCYDMDHVMKVGVELH